MFHKKYTKRFKRKVAVAYLRDKDYEKISEEYNVSISEIKKWVKYYKKWKKEQIKKAQDKINEVFKEFEASTHPENIKK